MRRLITRIERLEVRLLPPPPFVPPPELRARIQAMAARMEEEIGSKLTMENMIEYHERERERYRQEARLGR